MRRVGRNGSISLDCHEYFVGQRFAKQSVSVRLLASTGEIQIFSQGQLLKQYPLYGLQHRFLSFDDYVTLMEEQARADARRWRASARSPSS